MHVQIVTFRLADMTEEGYREACDGFTAAFAELPGLLAKIWLADPATDTYGGVEDLTRVTQPGLAILAEAVS